MSEEELHHNRRGALGPGQRRRLEARRRVYAGVRHALGPAAQQARAELAGIEKDLADGRVFVADGEVVFDLITVQATARGTIKRQMHDEGLSTYLSAYAPVARPRSPTGFLRGVDLLPGPYRFYVVPYSGLVVGAEAPPAAIAAGEHGRRITALLRTVQELDDETLAMNRQGRMTEAQKKYARVYNDAHMSCMLMGIILFAGGMSSWNLKKALSAGTTFFTFDVLGGFVIALVFLLFLPSTIKDERKAISGGKADAAEGRVAVQQGVLKKSHSRYRSVLRLTLRMGEHDFDVSDRPALFAAVVEGHVYRAYVGPRSGKLLALEFVEGAARSS
ncbi:uncharacterized protein SOCE26_029620 [Sorangium cellulosum]|uniref:Uncharacterized protein n=1 Tax=Sorangium cellulosum TaxID=56 RepID=A0A2L0EQL0_SORCE|nr:hypothetical protein [Sorangium cellulosum]AUX41542.1 uncharacterized protein SOCE26_029620 [Sorangium cellulosum]